MLTDTRIGSMRTVLFQIWANLYVEYVVKSPLSPVEHPGGVGVANELFEGGLEGFMVSRLGSHMSGALLTPHHRTRYSRQLHECWDSYV